MRSGTPPDAPNADVYQAVRDVIQSRLPEYAALAGASSPAAREDPCLAFENSSLMRFEFLHEGVPAGFVVKLISGPEGRRAAADEFTHLQRLHRHFNGTSPLRVPRPFDHIPEFDAIVMERVFSPRLDQLMRAGPTRWHRGETDSLSAYCHRAGRWLQALQALGPSDAPGTPPTPPAFSTIWSAELEGMIERATALALPGSLTRELEDALADPTHHLRGPCIPVHSDFTPYNVHVGRDVLYVTDFAEMPLGVADQCAAFFWAWLDISRTNPLRSRRILERCQAAFCDGFGRTLSPFWKTWGLLRQYSYLPEPATIRWSRRSWSRWRSSRLRSSLAERSRQLHRGSAKQSVETLQRQGEHTR